MLSSIGGLIIFALAYFAYQFFSEGKSRSEVKKRLTAEPAKGILEEPAAKTSGEKKQKKQITKKVAEKANDFYTTSDPNSIKKLRMMLIQAGYMNPGAVGYFIAARFAVAIGFALLGFVLILSIYAQQSAGFKMGIIVGLAAAGYFLPNFLLSRKISAAELSNRQGFPDILDLMVVSAEAGLTMEASIERIALEIKSIYPNLSMQLNMAAVEIRAGRPIDQALRAFGERLRLDEVKGFATMVQQAKELGTSVSDALRVYSDEMRHKRMMKAEEKAYALPAKMSVPVTVFILPIVIGIAVIPTIVRWN
ncbi:MAG: type II secretion system F family protein [Pseudomonadota bacterium]